MVPCWSCCGAGQDTLSVRDVAELVLTRGVTVTPQTARAGEERRAPLLTARVKARGRGTAGRTWHGGGEGRDG